MTTKPKAVKYRIRRNSRMTDGEKKPDTPPEAEAPKKRPKVSDGFGDRVFATAAGADQSEAEQENEAIKKEGLTGRQLRVARRVAHRHNLTVTSDYDAVRQLRAKGIDPFNKTAMLELVAPKGDEKPEPQLPQTVEKPQVPGPQVQYDEAARSRDVLRIQRDIARRRRRSLFLMFARLAVFVFLPTLIAGFYFFNIATPLYATNTEFVIQQANKPGGKSMGGLLSGTGFATSQDSITVQSYLTSRDAMLRLDKDMGFKAHFSGENIDRLRRLPPDATNERAYRLYKKMVVLGYDPTEGIIKMEVIATDPQTSEAMARALLTYAEEQVDQLTQRLREDQMRGARESFVEAEEKMLAAQQRVLELQEKLGVFDANSESSAVLGQVTEFENQLQQKRLQLQQLLDNARPNQARVDGLKGDIKRLEDVVKGLRSQLVIGGDETDSMARVTAEMRIAQQDLEIRTVMMQQSLEQQESARIEANRQQRYISMGVTPVAPDEPTYPRAFENTLVSFFVFAGIYLMLSITTSILREQVSA